MTVTVVASVVVPPAPLQLSENVVVAVRGPRVSVPELDRLPLQPPVAEQLVAPLALQLRVVEAPEATGLLAASRLTTGAGVGGAAATVTVLDRVTEPPLPLQVNEKVVVDVSGGLTSLPEAGRAPDQPAFAWPLLMELAERPRLNVGAGSGAAVTAMVSAAVALPSGPVQVSE